MCHEVSHWRRWITGILGVHGQVSFTIMVVLILRYFKLFVSSLMFGVYQWEPCMVYLPTCSMKSTKMSVNIPCMDPMGYVHDLFGHLLVCLFLSLIRA